MTESGATMSIDDVYRYELWRQWERGERLCFVMLNPSTADADIDDPTIRKCVGFAKRHGYGGIHVVNLFAARATNPKDLKTFDDPIGPKNDVTLVKVCSWSRTCVIAWGASKVGGDLVTRRIEQVTCLLPLYGVKPLCLGRSKDGSPRHPLMLSYQTPLESY